MVERDVQWTLTETPGAVSSGFGLRQEIKLFGILFTVQANLQEHSQSQLLAQCGGTNKLSPKRQFSIGTAGDTQV